MHCKNIVYLLIIFIYIWLFLITYEHNRARNIDTRGKYNFIKLLYVYFVFGIIKNVCFHNKIFIEYFISYINGHLISFFTMLLLKNCFYWLYFSYTKLINFKNNNIIVFFYKLFIIINKINTSINTKYFINIFYKKNINLAEEIF